MRLTQLYRALKLGMSSTQELQDPNPSIPVHYSEMLAIAQPEMDDKSSAVFIKHDLSFREQQEFSIACSFDIDVCVPRAMPLNDGISMTSLWEGKQPLE